MGRATCMRYSLPSWFAKKLNHDTFNQVENFRYRVYLVWLTPTRFPKKRQKICWLFITKTGTLCFIHNSILPPSGDQRFLLPGIHIFSQHWIHNVLAQPILINKWKTNRLDEHGLKRDIFRNSNQSNVIRFIALVIVGVGDDMLYFDVDGSRASIQIATFPVPLSNTNMYSEEADGCFK